jgi:hypothetical protein
VSGELSGFACLTLSGGDHFLLCYGGGVKEHWTGREIDVLAFKDAGSAGDLPNC